MEFWRLKLLGIPTGELDPAPVAEWLGGLPEGTVVELAWGASGLELRLGFPEGAEGEALVRAWGSLLRHGGAGERMAPPPPPAAYASMWAAKTKICTPSTSPTEKSSGNTPPAIM